MLVSDGWRGSEEPPPPPTPDSEAMMLLPGHNLRAGPAAADAQPPPSPPKSLSRCRPHAHPHTYEHTHTFTGTAGHLPPSPALSLSRWLLEKIVFRRCLRTRGCGGGGGCGGIARMLTCSGARVQRE